MWPSELAGVLRLGDGRSVRGRSLRTGVPLTASPPDWGLYLLGAMPPATPWAQRWVRWRDFWVPADTEDAVAAVV